MLRTTLAAVAALTFASAAAAQSPFRTVFVIVMENNDWSAIKGNPLAPYINNQLLPFASHAEAYVHPPSLHKSLPNYLWMEAGTNLGVVDDASPAVHSLNADHLVAQLTRAGISWKTYAEGIDGATCPVANHGLYAVRHNPMVYFNDIAPGGTDTTSAVCIAHIRPYSELASDLQNNTVASYNFIIPNKCNDMHDCGIDVGDAWLSAAVPQILNSQAYQNGGVLFITWDEGSTGGSTAPVGLIALSPYANANRFENSIPYSHSSLLRTMQTIFGVGPFLGEAASATDLSDLFEVGLNQSGAPVQVTNAASLSGGSIAPGEVVSIFGTAIGPATPIGPDIDLSQIESFEGGFGVRFNSVAAPLLYAGPNEIKVVAPYELTGVRVAQMQIVGGAVVPPMTLPVSPTAPGIFTRDKSGKGAGDILNQDGSLNSPTAPAAPGSTVRLFATGAGQTNPPGIDGRLASSAPALPLQPVSVTIGGMPAQVMYAGPAPGMVSGVLQVNVQVPAGAPTGNAVPIVMTIGGVSSQPGVTVSVGP